MGEGLHISFLICYVLLLLGVTTTVCIKTNVFSHVLVNTLVCFVFKSDLESFVLDIFYLHLYLFTQFLSSLSSEANF